MACLGLEPRGGSIEGKDSVTHGRWHLYVHSFFITTSTPTQLAFIRNTFALTSAKSMQISNMQSYNQSKKLPGLRQGLSLLCPRGLEVDEGAIRCQHISVSKFTCSRHGELV